MFRSEKIRKILRCAAFLCILALLAHGEERILNAKGAEDLSSAYFSEPKDSHDIILLGPSTIMNGVYPLLLWNRYGYTAYNLGAGNETIECSYYLAKRAIRQDHPRLIILDCGLLRKEDVIDSFSFLHFVTDRMPFLSPERLELLAHLAVYGKPSLGGLLKLCFPLLEYHERWADLTEADFAEQDKTITYGAKVDPRKMSRAPEPFAMREGNPDTVLPAHSDRMLRKLIGLCKETGTGLLLVSMPTLNKTKYIGQKTYEARVDTAAAVGKIAAELDVPTSIWSMTAARSDCPSRMTRWRASISTSMGRRNLPTGSESGFPENLILRTGEEMPGFHSWTSAMSRSGHMSVSARADMS